MLLILDPMLCAPAISVTVFFFNVLFNEPGFPNEYSVSGIFTYIQHHLPGSYGKCRFHRVQSHLDYSRVSSIKSLAHKISSQLHEFPGRWGSMHHLPSFRLQAARQLRYSTESLRTLWFEDFLVRGVPVSTVFNWGGETNTSLKSFWMANGMDKYDK